MTPRYSLHFDSGERRGEVVPIPGFPFTIGRRPGNSLQVVESSVSGRHAELVLADGGLLVRDLGSTNGTRVGTERVLEGALRPGATFAIGNVAFVLHDAEAAPAGAGDAAPPERLAPAIGDAALARARKRSLVGPIVLFVLAGVAVVAWTWLRRGGASREGELRAVPAYSDALFATSFEPGEPGWESVGEAAAAFVPGARARLSGKSGIAAELAAGEEALQASPAVAVRPGTALVAEVELRAPAGAAGRLGVELSSSTGAAFPVTTWSDAVSAAGTFQSVTLPVTAPAGYDRARLLLGASGGAEGGTVQADDARLRAAGTAAPEVRVDEFRVLAIGRAHNLFLVDRTLLSGIVLHAEGAAATEALDVEALAEESGARLRPAAAGATVLVARIEPPLAGGGVATMGPRGYSPRAEDFDEPDVTDLVLGRGVDLVRIAFGAPVEVRARKDGEGWRLRARLPAGVEPLVQVRFRAERETRVNLVHDAEGAERRGAIGECLAAWQRLLDEVPFEDGVVQRAQSERARHLRAGFEELGQLTATLERAGFFGLPELYRTSRERAVAIAARYGGSEVERAALELVTEIDQELAELDAPGDRVEEERLRSILAVLEASGDQTLAGEVREALETAQARGGD